MNFYYSFLLLLVVLSAYSEGPQYAKPPDLLDLTVVTVCPNNSSISLGVLAPMSPQNEVYMSVLPQNYMYMSILPQIVIFEIVLLQTEANNTVLPQNGVIQMVTVNFQLFNSIKTILNFMMNLGVKSFKFLPSTLVRSGEKLGWTIRILLESLRYALEMYAWSLSETQASVQFRCRLIGLLSKQSLFRKHDFAVLVHRVYHGYQNLHYWNLNLFPKYKISTYTHVVEEHTEKSSRYQFHGGGKALLFSFDELLPYAPTDWCEQQYQFLRCVKNKQNVALKCSSIFGCST